MKVSQHIRTPLKKQPREHIKLWVGRLFFPTATRRWLSFIESHHVLLPYVARFPRLITRIYRPYGFRSLSSAQRVDLMIGHYEWLRRLGLDTLLSASVDIGYCLSEIETKSKKQASLHLHAIHDGHREGEMSLQLFWSGDLLFTLNFILMNDSCDCALLITRLQAKINGDGREKIRQATKDMYGCRPAILLVQAARQLAHSAHCKRVLLVSNQQRVALNPKRRFSIKADNDRLWQELGAIQQSNGFFSIDTCVNLPQDFSEVASNKRSEAKRKVAFLTRFLASLADSVESCRQTAFQA